MIADAGFRAPFFRYVERLGWHWLGRIRSRDLIRWESAPQAQDLGQALWIRNAPLGGRLVLIRCPRQGLQDRSPAGARRRSRLSRRHANRQPWLLVRLYKTRMQIEEAFRDTKSAAYGLGTANEARTNLARAANMLLIAVLAAFALWIVGCLARARGWERNVHVSSCTHRSAYSAPFLARLVIGPLTGRLPSAPPMEGPSARRQLSALGVAHLIRWDSAESNPFGNLSCAGETNHGEQTGAEQPNCRRNGHITDF